jgi:hypothetical protein
MRGYSEPQNEEVEVKGFTFDVDYHYESEEGGDRGETVSSTIIDSWNFVSYSTLEEDYFDLDDLDPMQRAEFEQITEADIYNALD